MIVSLSVIPLLLMPTLSSFLTLRSRGSYYGRRIRPPSRSLGRFYWAGGCNQWLQVLAGCISHD